MSTVVLTTVINATVERCFDAARDISVHERSTAHTNERAVAGRTKGLCEAGDEITWEAIHFGVKQRLTVRITRMEAPHFFEDIMVKGAFKSMQHEHYFEMAGNQTIMRDVFTYEVPFGMLGRLSDKIVLKSYMRRFLQTRNQIIKEVAEQEG